MKYLAVLVLGALVTSSFLNAMPPESWEMPAFNVGIKSVNISNTNKNEPAPESKDWKEKEREVASEPYDEKNPPPSPSPEGPSMKKPESEKPSYRPKGWHYRRYY